MHFFEFSPAPHDAGVLHYRIERSQDGGITFEPLVEIPNRQDNDAFFDYPSGQFKFSLPEDATPTDTFRIASVSDVVGPWSYFYVPNTPPPPPVPVLVPQRPRSPYDPASSARQGNAFVGARLRNVGSISDNPRRRPAGLVVGALLILTLGAITVKALRA